MAGKRAGLAIASGLLTLLGTIPPKGDLETIVAQDAKPVVDIKEEQPDTYKKIAEYFTNSATEFYTKAKDTNKTKEAANLALIFDSENKEAKELIQKAEKNKLKTNNKELKKAEENYSKNKEQAINELYNSAIQKIQTDKKEALKILDDIWKIDEKSEKPLEARAEKLNWKKNDSGIYVPPVIWEARENGKKILEESGEGEEYKAEDELEEILKLNNFHKRKSDWLIVRAKTEDDAKRMHKVGETGLKYIPQRISITEWPFLPDQKEREIMKELKIEKTLFRITQFENANEFSKYNDSILKNTEDEVKNPSIWTRMKETWEPHTKTSEKKQRIHAGQTHHSTTTQERDDNIIHLLSNKIRVENGNTSQVGWIYHGFDYLMSLEILGTALYNEYDVLQGKYKSDDKESFIKIKDHGDAIRKYIYDSMLNKKDYSLENIVRIDHEDKFTPDTVCFAISITEFLLDKYQKEYSSLLIDRRDKTHRWYGKKNLEAFKEAFGKEANEFNEEYRQWVLENYVGYRK